MSSARSVSHAAFLEEYDEDAQAILPDTRRVATTASHQPSSDGPNRTYHDPQQSVSRLSSSFDSLYDATEPPTPHRRSTRSRASSEVEPSGYQARIAPHGGLTPINVPPWGSHTEGSFFDEIDRVRSLHSLSPTGATVASRFSDDHRTDRRSTLSPDTPSVLRDNRAAPQRQRPRRQVSTFRNPQQYRPPVYPPLQPYVQTPYATYHPSYGPPPYATQSLPPPSPTFYSPYGSPYYWHYPGTTYPPPHASKPDASENPNQTIEPTPQVDRHSSRPIHRFRNLRRLQSDQEADVPEKNSRPWRAFTREIPVNLPGRPQMKLERYDIVQSRVISGASFGKENAAILTYDAAQGEDCRPETCWIHYTSDILELESFMMEILRLKEVPENAFPIITDLFKELEQVYEKPFVHGRYLEPIVRRFAGGDSDEGDKKPNHSVEVVFIAFPYLSLEPFRLQPNTGRRPVHPVRSLLQFHYSFVSTVSRDKHQVSCNVGNEPGALHVPQIWILLINDDLIVSTGPASIDGMRGNYVHLEKATPPPSVCKQRQIRLLGLQGKEYCFSLDQCKTWFEFIKALLGALNPGSPMVALFVDDTWRDTVQLLVGDKPVSETNWIDTIHAAGPGDVTIRLVQKASSPESQNMSLAASGEQNHKPFTENQLVITSKARAGCHSFLPTRPSEFSYYRPYPLYNTEPFAPFSDSSWFSNIYTDTPEHSFSNPNQALVVRSTNTVHDIQHKNSNVGRRKLLPYGVNTAQRDARPIQLTDLSGTCLPIPWRIGQSWANMYPVVGIKMQCTSEHRQAFIADDYVLDGPDGPIDPADWNEKIYPGISVAIRLKSTTIHEQLDDTVSQSTQTERPLSSSSQAGEEADSLCSNVAGLEGADAGGGGDGNSTSSLDGQSSIAHLSPDDGTPLADCEVNVFDFLLCNKDDAEYLEKEGPLGVKNPFRYQVRNDAWKTKETLIEDGPSSSVLSITSNASSSSSSPATSSVTSPLLTLPSDRTASDAAIVLPDTANVSGMCPLFEWKIESRGNHDLSSNSSTGRFGERKPKDEGDSEVGALLEGCDKEAFWILSSHPDQNAVMNAVMNNLPKSTYIQVQVEMERTRVRLLNLGEDSDDSHSLERRVWARKERIIQDALHLLDSFIPLHYQKLDESWLIGKFFGAIYSIVRGSGSKSTDFYLEEIEIILSCFVKIVDRIHAGVAYNSNERLTAPILPPSLVHGFPPLVFLVCICSQLLDEGCQPEGWHTLQVWAEQCYGRLTRGKFELIDMARTGEYTKAKVFTRVDAEDIIALVLKRLAEFPRANLHWQDKTKDGFDMLEMYKNHISQLEFQARRNPSSDLFDAMQQLMEEIQILHLVLNQQLNVLEGSLEVLSCSDDLPTKLSASAISHSRQHLKQTQHDLSQLESMADRAAVALRYMLEVRKESNSKAITLFTIVTVIFLPLSFVTSYLGMNSVDIRGGSFTQGLFWAIAMPIAAFLVGGLWVALRFRRRIRRVAIDRLGSCRRWWRGTNTTTGPSSVVVDRLAQARFSFGSGQSDV